MSWDDEDFAVPVSGNDFGEEEELFDDWEAAANSDDDKPKVVKPKISSAQRIANKKKQEKEERERKAMEKTQQASKKEQLDKEIDADLDSAADLLAAADIHPRSKAGTKKTSAGSSASDGPTKLSDLAIFKPTNAKEYASLRQTVAPILNDLHAKNSQIQHTNFVVETCRDLMGPLTSDQVEKVIATLQASANAKFREERAKRLGSRVKPMVKQSSAKQQAAPVKVPEVAELEDDGLDDDDFM